MSYVNSMSYVNYINYVNYMSYVTCMSIFMNHLKPFEIAWNHLIFVFKKFGIFVLRYKDGKRKP